MSAKTKNTIIFLTLIVVFLIFLRIDYRFNSTVKCCSDEYDYFLHATTIVYDFDLDYSNQNLRNFSYSYGEKKAPIGFVGTGILASPFLYLGKTLRVIFNESPDLIMNFELLLYSLSSVVYFFLSFFILIKIMHLMNVDINKYKLLLIFSASGLPYYAFERFGMTHSFEIFTIFLLIFLILKFYQSDKLNNIYGLFIPFVLLTSYLTRMSNFFIFLLPLIVKKYYLLNNKSTYLLKNKYFLFGTILSTLLFTYISNSLYGRIIINPQLIYGDTRDITIAFKNFDVLFIDLVKSFIKILFTFEFGIFWLNPIVFIGLIYSFFQLKDFRNLVNWLNILCFAQCFYIVYLWQTTASSYGFRYLLPLVPLSFFIYFLNYKNDSFLNKYLTFFSLFSILGVIFFETTELTQLSTTPQVNSFGTYIRYVEPEYVKGVFIAIFSFESYLIIFSTSFLGAIFFKTFTLLIGSKELFDFLGKLGLPIDNLDFLRYMDNINLIGIEKFILLFLLLSYFSYLIVFQLNKKSKKKIKG